MEYTEFEQLFCESAIKNGLPTFNRELPQTFFCFTEHLMEVNQITNLTAIRNIPDTITKHLIDSLFAVEYLPQGASILDIGCGAGFPSIPLAIARPDLTIVALDSTSKKIKFVQDSAKLLKLSNLTAISGRAEDLAMMKKLGMFDVVVSRAVAKMSVLSELCLPYVKIGGFLLALKASKAEEELVEASNAIKILGGASAQLHYKTLFLPEGSSEVRCLIEITKAKDTPVGYPRAYASILKKPL